MGVSERVRWVVVVVVIAAGVQTVGAVPAAVDSPSQTDPEVDQLGWENGYWHNDSVDVDQTDGLSDAELDALLARSMARVEQIRGLEFTEPVEVEFVSPEELDAPRNDTYGLSTDEQLWEALFFHGESTNATRAVRQDLRASVLGFAAEEGSDKIVIAGDPSRPTVSGGTLVHELVHMLQDQQFDLSQDRYRRSTLDGEFAKDGLVEGEATSVTSRYRARCEDDWSCVGAPPNGPSPEPTASERFSQFTYFPYAVGERYVNRLIERGGWSAVTAAHDDPPVSTEQVLHPEADRPASLSVPDRSRNGWHRIGNETIGEAGIYALFWRQSGPSPISEANRSQNGDSYTSQPSAGWGSDRLDSYTDADGERSGYVWTTRWDTARDARQFHDAYVQLLQNEGASHQENATWVISDGEFADAFSVTHNETTVTIVNGPTPDALADIHARNGSVTTDTASQTSSAGPGVGVLGAIAALVLGGVLRLVR